MAIYYTNSLQTTPIKKANSVFAFTTALVFMLCMRIPSTSPDEYIRQEYRMLWNQHAYTCNSFNMWWVGTVEPFKLMHAQLRLSINVSVGTYSCVGGTFCAVAEVCAPY